MLGLWVIPVDDQEHKAQQVEEAMLPHMCPRRGELPPSAQFPTQDVWRLVGPDRVCSFCGSIHSEDLRALLPSVVDGAQIHLDVSDRRHKVYIRRPGIRNAGEGAIKFYLVHGPPNTDKGFWDLLNDKCVLYRRKMHEQYGRGGAQ